MLEADIWEEVKSLAEVMSPMISSGEEKQESPESHMEEEQGPLL